MGKLKFARQKYPVRYFFSCVLEKTQRYTEESRQEICVEIGLILVDTLWDP